MEAEPPIPDGFVEVAPPVPEGFIEVPPGADERAQRILRETAYLDGGVGKINAAEHAAQNPATRDISGAQMASELHETLSQPIVPIPQTSPEFRKEHGIVAGAADTLGGLVNFFQSGEGALLLGAGALPKAVQMAAATAFAAHAVKNAPETAVQLATSLREGDAYKATMALGELGLDAAMVRGLGHFADRPGAGGMGAAERGAASEPPIPEGFVEVAPPVPEGFVEVPQPEAAGEAVSAPPAEEPAIAIPSEEAPPPATRPPPEVPLEPPQEADQQTSGERSALEQAVPVEAAVKPVEAEAPAAPEGFVEVASGEDPGGKIVGLRNSYVDERRTAMGLPPAMEPMRLSNEAAWDEGMKTLAADPAAGARLVSEMNAKPRALAPAEEAVFLHEQAVRETEHAAAVDAVNSAETPEARLAAQERLAAARDSVQEAFDANKKFGTEAGRSLQGRKLAVNPEDWSLARMEAEVRSLKPKDEPLTAKEAADVAALREQLVAAQARVGELEAGQHSQAANDAYNVMLREMGKSVKAAAKQGRSLLDFLHEQRDAARQRLGGTQFNTGIDPIQAFNHIIIGASHIADGIVAIGEFTAKMVAEFGEKILPLVPEIFAKSKAYLDAAGQAFKTKGKPQTTPAGVVAAAKAAGGAIDHAIVRDLAHAHILAGVHGFEPVMAAVLKDARMIDPATTLRDVHRAYSEYGKVTFPSKEADKVELSELRNIARLQESVARLSEGLDALKTGPQRNRATQAIREKQAELNALLRKRGLTKPATAEKLAGVNDARATGLRNAIADLDKELATGVKRAEGPAVPPSAEVEDLMMKRDAMRELLARIEADAHPPATAEEKQVEGLARIRQRLDETLAGLRDPTKAADFKPLSAAAEDMQAEILAMRELAAQMRRDAKPANDPSAAMEKVRIKALESAIERYRQKTAANDFSGKGRTHGPDTARVAALKEVRDSRRSMYQAAQRAGRPVLTPEARYNETRSKQIASRTSALEAKIAAGDYASTPRRVLPALAPENIKALADYQRLREKWENEKRNIELRNRGGVEKGADWLVKWHRFAVISGIKVLGKLAVAGQGRIAMTAADTAAGAALRRVPGLGEVFARDPRSGGSVAGLARGYVQGWLDTVKQAGNVIRTGRTDLEAAAKTRTYDQSFLDYVGNLHNLMKLPAFSQEYRISLNARTEHAMRTGVDMTEPFNQLRISNEAVQDGLRAKFGQDNFVTKRVQMWLASMRSEKAHPTTAKLVEKGIRFLLPVTHIPTNYFAESATYGNLGLGLPRALFKTMMAFRNGIDTLKPEEANSIVRHWQKGALGAGLTLLGFYLRNNIGGYYQSGKRGPDDPEFGGVRLFGNNVPRFMVHLPIFEPLHIGATIGRVMDHETKKTGEHGTLPDGVMAAAAGLIDEIPYISNARNVSEMLAEGGRGKSARGRMASSTVVPMAVREIAKWSDLDPGGEPVKRVPKTTLEFLMNDIPGVRKTLPQK